MSSPLVSVLLPVLGPDPRYFLPAVRSVLDQTFEDFELLIVEEPSASSAAELLREISDSRIRHIYRAERTRKRLPTELMLRDYESAWDLYLLACIKY